MSGRGYGRLLAVLLGMLCCWAGAEAGTDEFVVAPLTADHTVAPGAVVSGRLQVFNKSEEPASFSISLQDFTTDAAGEDGWDTLGSHARSLHEWITFRPSFLTVPGKETGYVDYEIRVPGPGEPEDEAATHEGSYWAAVMIETERERKLWDTPPETEKVSRFGIGIAFVYAIKIYANVEGTERRALKAVKLEATPEPGGMVATFTNTGNVILRPRVWLEVRDLEGEIVARLDTLTWTLQPGLGHHYPFSLQDLDEPIADGRYQLAIIADYGAPRLLGLSAPLNLSSAGELQASKD